MHLPTIYSCSYANLTFYSAKSTLVDWITGWGYDTEASNIDCFLSNVNVQISLQYVSNFSQKL